MSTTTECNIFAHHVTVSAVQADWLQRRAGLDRWADRAERGRLATHCANRCDEIRRGTTTAPYRAGDIVRAADPAAMLQACDTYHSGVTHGVVVDVRPEYSAGVFVVWYGADGPQSVSYGLEPAMLATAENPPAGNGQTGSSCKAYFVAPELSPKGPDTAPDVSPAPRFSIDARGRQCIAWTGPNGSANVCQPGRPGVYHVRAGLSRYNGPVLIVTDDWARAVATAKDATGRP